MADESRPPDWLQTASNPEVIIDALDEADTLSVWDLPQDYGTLKSVASLIEVDISSHPTRAEVEVALVEYFSDE